MKKMKNKIFALLFLVSLSGCTASEVRHGIGISKQAPDEFLVLPREKLKLPETAVALPTPTEKVEGRIAASQKAKEALFGESAKSEKSISELELSVIEKAKADKANPNIRKLVLEEHQEKTGVFGTERGGTLESILDPFGYNKPVEPVVDAKAENKRIKEALSKGEKISGKNAKTKDPRKEQWEEDANDDEQ